MGSGSGGDARLLKTELDSLKGFKAQVDELLTFLQGSWAAPQRIAEGHLVPAQLGSGFAEVDSLSSAYSEVHGQLKTLSQLLNDQIEALGTAVHAARVGYANVDADLRSRMWAIQARTKELYEPGLDPNARAAKSRAASHAPTPPPAAHSSSEGGI
ncbi:hypothetical protein [Streptomyces cinnamoneus]|uniref:Uncharacterized protein n=1 Tax=Streptomyces cinnamoneus TaxID=53446 RepID=A0A918TWN8_STRCJ|nr:hypothetical protein [Streptomyces cinnamoneus]GHC65617.1 hypothetical protein GCM10010507_49110 [Streptomyces cinnamoneus]